MPLILQVVSDLSRHMLTEVSCLDQTVSSGTSSMLMLTKSRDFMYGDLSP